MNFKLGSCNISTDVYEHLLGMVIKVIEVNEDIVNGFKREVENMAIEDGIKESALEVYRKVELKRFINDFAEARLDHAFKVNGVNGVVEVNYKLNKKRKKGMSRTKKLLVALFLILGVAAMALFFKAVAQRIWDNGHAQGLSDVACTSWAVVEPDEPEQFVIEDVQRVCEQAGGVYYWKSLERDARFMVHGCLYKNTEIEIN